MNGEYGKAFVVRRNSGEIKLCKAFDASDYKALADALGCGDEGEGKFKMEIKLGDILRSDILKWR